MFFTLAFVDGKVSLQALDAAKAREGSNSFYRVHDESEIIENPKNTSKSRSYNLQMTV